MNSIKPSNYYLVKPFPLSFLLGLILVNVVALFPINPFYSSIGAFFAFFYIVIIPGFLLLPFFIKKRLPPLLGLAFSVALSLLLLMLVGLAVNTALPLLGMMQPLTTLPLLLAFDVLMYLLLSLNFFYKKASPFEFHEFNATSWVIAGMAFLAPVFAVLGTISLNNGGSNAFTMASLALVLFLIPIVIIKKADLSLSIPPLVLYMIALALLLMNAMRGWFITGHDILLEYHVFILTNSAHLWSMALYHDPYTACLSLTILPTFLQTILHVSDVYIFKLFFQFFGALPVVLIYYLAKEYTSKMIAFLAGFLYTSFPTFIVDMAFLNRQGMAFIFFGAILFVLLATEYFEERRRTALLLLLGAGMVLSHYSTSYVAIALFAGAYVINRILRVFMTAERPHWLSRLTDKIGNKEIYQRPVLLTLSFVIGLFCIMILWSVVITKTSSNLLNTLQQIAVNIQHPFGLDGFSGAAKYSLVQSKAATPQELFMGFLQEGIQQAESSTIKSNLFPLSLAENYSTVALPEPLIPVTPFGQAMQSLFNVNLADFFNNIKQAYAKILQVLLLLGIAGIMLGYTFKKNLLHIPAEYIALSLTGIAILVGQTVLPSNAIDYGLLRLFQQNLMFLALPITMGLLSLTLPIVHDHKAQLLTLSGILLFFYLMLSGFFSQFTGGARAALPLNNYGFYYDAYYTHTQEKFSINWLAQNADPSLPIQADHYFSTIKIIAYANIPPLAGLLPETIERSSYVYLNYNNAKTSAIIEYFNGDAFYYHFPRKFLDDNKDLIYNNGGSEIYR